MLTAGRALTLNATSGPELPRVDGLQDLYAKGMRLRQGEVVMIAGRSGHQKSGFALYWVAQMGLPSLYFSGDMSAFQASVRLAQMQAGHTLDEVEAGMMVPDRRRKYVEMVNQVPMTFSFGTPITWRKVDEELAAFVELYNTFPKVMVFDNLMDIEGAQSEYSGQMDAMQGISELSRATGATIFVLHHASDKGWAADQDPWKPPTRSEVKGGMAEKPELALTVALDPLSHTYRVSIVKQRMGPSDAQGGITAMMQADPARTQFRELPH